MRPKIRRRNRDPLPVVEDDPLLQLMRDVDEADGASPDAIMPQSPRERLRWFREQARVNGGRMSQEVLPWLYETMIRLRVMKVPHAEIARQLGVSTRAEMYHWAKAKVSMQWQNTNLDPAQYLMEGLEALRMLDERALSRAMGMGAEDTVGFHRMAAVKLRAQDRIVAFLDRFGYFDAVDISRMRAVDENSAEARATRFREALDEAFAPPTQDEIKQAKRRVAGDEMDDEDEIEDDWGSAYRVEKAGYMTASSTAVSNQFSPCNTGGVHT